MPKFSYVALDARGQESVGVVEASTSNDARRSVAARRDTSRPACTRRARSPPPRSRKSPARSPKPLRSPRRFASSKAAKAVANKKVKPKILMIFTRQLATLIDAGLPLLRGLVVLEKQERDPVLKATIAKLSDAVQGGSTFSEGLAQHPKIFNKLYINIGQGRRGRRRARTRAHPSGRVPGKGAKRSRTRLSRRCSIP